MHILFVHFEAKIIRQNKFSIHVFEDRVSVSTWVWSSAAWSSYNVQKMQFLPHSKHSV